MTTTPDPTPAGSAPRPASRLLELVPVALVVVAEAAWVSVVGGFIQEVRLQAPVLGIPILAAFVAAGVVAARTLGLRLGRGLGGGRPGAEPAGRARSAGSSRPTPARPSPPATRRPPSARTRAAGSPAWPSCAASPTRGSRSATRRVDRMLRLGIPGLALIAVIGGAVAEPWRGIFLADTLVAAVVFVGCGTLALAFARQRAVGADLHVDWRRNRSWLGLLVGAVGRSRSVGRRSALVRGRSGRLIPVLLGIAARGRSSSWPRLRDGPPDVPDRRHLRRPSRCSSTSSLTFVDRPPTPPPPPDVGPGRRHRRRRRRTRP